MRVLVTGAGGFVGSHIVGALVKAGYLVRGLVRKMPPESRERLGVEYEDDIDVTMLSTLLPELFEDVDAIVHLVGIIREGAGNQTFERIHVDATQNLIDAADNAGFMGRFIYLSAIGASPESDSAYARSKFAAEEIARAGRPPYTIIRPSLILGRDAEFVQQMRDLVLHGGLPIPLPMPFIPVPGPGTTKFQPVAIGDIAACVIGCLEDETTAYKTFEVGGATEVTFNGMVEAFSQRLGVNKPIVHVPLGLMGVSAGLMEAILPKPPVTRDQLINLNHDNIAQGQTLEDVFKILPLSFEQILDRIFAN